MYATSPTEVALCHYCNCNTVINCTIGDTIAIPYTCPYVVILPFWQGQIQSCLDGYQTHVGHMSLFDTVQLTRVHLKRVEFA